MTEATNFAVNARKAIEIASIIDPVIIANARELRVHMAGEKMKLDHTGDEVELTSRSLLWCLSRIIHSVQLWILQENTLEQVTEKRIYSRNFMRTLGVSSDLDGASTVDGRSVYVEVIHYIGVEGLVGAYSFGVSPMIEAVIANGRKTDLA